MSYTFSLSRRSLPVRCLCLLLIAVLLFCFFMCPRAGAVAVEAATVAYAGALVGTILVGAGVIFSSHGDMQKVGAAMYKSWIKSSNAIGSKISAIAAWAVEHGEAAAKGALRVSKDLYQGIVDAFKAACSGGRYYFSGEGLELSSSPTDEQIKSVQSISAQHWLYFYFDTTKYSWRVSDSDYLQVYRDGSPYKGIGSVRSLTSAFFEFEISGSIINYYLVYNDSFGVHHEHVNGRYLPVWFGAVPRSVSAGASDLVYPSDSYLVKMPDIPSVDTVTGEATFPADAAYTKDAVSVPYPVDTEGVKVPDIPYDKVVDQSTGKALDDTGTDTDTPSKPGEGTGAGSNTGLLQKILDLLKNFFDSPSDFRLNMDGFRNLAIADKFPFCIPFDLVDSIKQFAVTAKDFHFRIKLDTHYFKVDHEVDLSDMVLPFAFFRYMVLVWFVWMLMLRTRDLVKW